ncbi:MAG: hypothetical protein ACFE0J_08735 [Elainellaceae cyanobacterium]
MDSLAIYRETLRQRQVAEQHQLTQRFDQAIALANRAAHFLKQEMGAT